MGIISGNPDFKLYRTQLEDTLRAIEDCAVYTAPNLGNVFSPFWVIGRPSFTVNTETWSIKRWDISIEFFLAREKLSNMQIEGLADVIDDDVVNVVNYFSDNQHLITKQDGFLDGTFRITANSDSSFNTASGTWLGSSFTLSFVHRVVYENSL